ncbi:hypothetical protein EX895_001949 [Sporisorium graminicola]|uniref:Uncharacterized protein n=1 Tax=Sporisorium graminicola TaxID=280036 RepID=A0A4U7L0Z9_9BASI|nr:hypothetical protein EX895_001949 [Sporisorium graminicola]TKY89418.1 hypothetical protein EX895_001949 [Sporisorium graminicola]
MTDSTVANNVSNGASSAYASITSSAQRVLPVASTIVSEATGFAALSETYSDAPTAQPEHPGASSTVPSDDPSSSTDQPDASVLARDDTQEELERGPSSSERPQQSQSHIGTESDIPTTGGAGTTASPDDDVKDALAKEGQKHGGASQAAVGVDYSDQPCPTADARRETPTSKPAEGKTQFDSREQQLHGSSENSSASSDPRSESTAATSAPQDAESGTSKGSSLKDKLKGQAKVVAGKITRNEEKVEQDSAVAAMSDTAAKDWQPVPISLDPIFRLSCPVEKAHVVGDSGEGLRKIVPISAGGTMTSTTVRAFDGAVGMPGGSDYFRTDRFGKTRLDARYFFQLKSGHNLFFQSSGIRFVPETYEDQTAKEKLLAGQDLDPNLYYFRLKLILECDNPDPQVQDIVNKIVIASAVRHPDRVVYQAYVVQ